MRYSTVLAAVSALAGFAVAQSSNSSDTIVPCCSVPVNQVPEDDRQTWCNAQENTCVDICGGQGEIASNGNTCDASTLDYTCSCSNGTTISQTDMAQYEQTVPGQMCRFWYDACNNATFGANGEGNRAEQFKCEQARDQNCGKQVFNDTASSTASASSSATGTSSPTSGTATGAAATGSGTSTPSSAAIAKLALGTPALAGGLLAVFGLAL